MKLSSVTVKLQLPYIGGIEGNWQPDQRERDAAWEMYVELITRIAVVELHPDEGLVREALTSLYSLFDTTRGILRKYGPSIAKSKRGSDLSFGYIAVSVLNGLLRPLLAKWHPLLAGYEAQRDPGISPVDHEHRWVHAPELRQEIDATRRVLRKYADILAEVAGIEPLPWPENEAPTDVG
jgi:hypothetical protein